MAVFGDLGIENGRSIPQLKDEAQRGMYHAVFHIGDFAYDMDSVWYDSHSEAIKKKSHGLTPLTFSSSCYTSTYCSVVFCQCGDGKSSSCDHMISAVGWLIWTAGIWREKEQ